MPDYTLTASSDGKVTLTCPGWAAVKALNFERSNDNAINYDPQSVPVYSETGVWTFGPLKPGRHIIRVSCPGGVPNFADYVTVPAATAPAARMIGTIADNGDVATNATLMKSAGFNTVREWWELNPTTGALVTLGRIDRAKAYLDAGFQVIACMSFAKSPKSAVFPAAAIAETIARADKRTLIECLNESNNPEYAPNSGSDDAHAPARMAAEKMAAEMSRALQPAGFKTLSTNYAYGHGPTLKAWYKGCVDRNEFPFDYVSTHVYPNFDPSWNGTAINSAREMLDAALVTGKPAVVTEWGYNGSWTAKGIAEAQPEMAKLLNEKTVGAAYFIFTRTYNADGTPRLPHDKFAWLYDPKTREKTATFATFEKLQRGNADL